MDNRISETISFSENDYDSLGRLRSSSILMSFQRAAEIHSKMMGVGINELMKHGESWVVLRNKYEIISTPPCGSKLTIETWPSRPRRMILDRNYLIKDVNGNVVIKGESQWVILNIESRKIVTESNVNNVFDTYCEDKPFGEKMSRISDFENADIHYSVLPSQNDIDINGHVNNTKYADFINEALDKDAVIKRFEIEYKKEILLNQNIDIFGKHENNIYTVKGCNNGDIMFIARITV